MNKFPDYDREMSITTVENGFVVTAVCLVEHPVSTVLLHRPPPSDWQREVLTFVFSTRKEVLVFMDEYMTCPTKGRLDEHQTKSETTD